jgi:hypothetical protein
MMEALLLTGGILFTLLGGLSSIWQIRGYLRTGMKTYLYWGIGFAVFLVFFPACSIEIRPFGYDANIIVMALLYLTAFYFRYSGLSILHYDEKALWQEMCEKTTYWQRLTGNVPILEHQKPRPLPISKRSGLALGILSTTLGAIVIVLFILFKVPIVSTNTFTAAILAAIYGLLLIIFSILCLEKDKKRR